MSKSIVKYFITDKLAVIPKKAYTTDTFKQISGDIALFETGIIVSPDSDHYIEILPRSSITKSGYMLANSVGIIDPSYKDSFYYVSDCSKRDYKNK
jgi:dUTPase